MDLENAVQSGQDKVRLGSGPSASGLIKKLKNHQAIHLVHFLCDALKPVTQLALTFEKNDIDLSTIHPSLKEDEKKFLDNLISNIERRLENSRAD